MIFGSAEDWASRFKQRDERLIERICEILPNYIATMPNNPHEDDITINIWSAGFIYSEGLPVACMLGI